MLMVMRLGWWLREWKKAVVVPRHEIAIKERNNHSSENRFYESCHMLIVKIKLKIFIAQGAVAIVAIGNHIVQMMGIVVRESLCR